MTSGTSTFNATRNDLIRGAARKCGALRQGESMGSAAIANFEHNLNAMVKHWQSKGLHVWTVSEGVLVPQANQRDYDIGTTSTANVAYADDFFQAATSADAAANATTISIETTDTDGTANMAAADKVGILLDDGTIHWTTIISKTTSDILLTAGLASAASSGAAVFTYTSPIVRPLKVVHARRYDFESDQEIPLNVEARLDYLNIPNKNSVGPTTSVFYDPKLTLGRLSTWQVPDAITELIRFTHWRPIQDFNAGGDYPDLPQEWILTIEYNLAFIMAPEYGLGPQRYQMVKEQAAQYLDDVSGFDREAESYSFGVDFDR